MFHFSNVVVDLKIRIFNTIQTCLTKARIAINHNTILKITIICKASHEIWIKNYTSRHIFLE